MYVKLLKGLKRLLKSADRRWIEISFTSISSNITKSLSAASSAVYLVALRDNIAQSKI